MNLIKPCLPAIGCSCATAGMVRTKECPYEGGRAVLRAWALLKSRGDSTWYDAESQCDTSGNSRKSQNYSEQISLKINPNPTSGICNFLYKIPENRSAYIYIYNTYGQLVDNIFIPANIKTINYQTEKLVNGIYYCKLAGSGRQTGSCKLIVIH